MRSHWAEVPFLACLSAHGTSHNNGLKLGRLVGTLWPHPQGLEEAGNALYTRQPHVPGLRGRTPCPQAMKRDRSVAVHIRRLRTPVLCQVPDHCSARQTAISALLLRI